MITAIRNTDLKTRPAFGHLSHKMEVPPSFVEESKLFEVSHNKTLFSVIADFVKVRLFGTNKTFGNK